MKKALPATCLSLTALLACMGAVGLSLLAIVAVVGVQFFVTLLDEVTASTDIPPDSPAFYQDPGGWDFRRIPLIAPYQALSIDDQTWYVELKTNAIRYQYSAGAIDQIAVVDQTLIVLHSATTPANATTPTERWTVIVPAEAYEQSFTDPQAFLDYLAVVGAPELHWASPEQLYATFVETGYLEWFPEEYQKK